MKKDGKVCKHAGFVNLHISREILYVVKKQLSSKYKTQHDN